MIQNGLPPASVQFKTGTNDYSIIIFTLILLMLGVLGFIVRMASTPTLSRIFYVAPKIFKKYVSSLLFMYY